MRSQLFKVSLRRSAPVLVKVYGDGTEITIDRNSGFLHRASLVRAEDV